jgi:hypothetical protein
MARLRDFNIDPSSVRVRLVSKSFVRPIAPLLKEATLCLSIDPTDEIKPVAGMRLFVSLIRLVSILAALISESQQPNIMNCDNIRAVAMNSICNRDSLKMSDIVVPK